jgi:hypothetical protein
VSATALRHRPGGTQQHQSAQRQRRKDRFTEEISNRLFHFSLTHVRAGRAPKPKPLNQLRLPTGTPALHQPQTTIPGGTQPIAEQSGPFW